MKFINKILLLSFAAFFISCEESTSSNSNEEGANSTLENSDLGGLTGILMTIFMI